MRRNTLLESKCTALFNRVRLPIVGVYERPPFRTQSRRPFNRRKRTDQRLFLNGDHGVLQRGILTRGSLFSAYRFHLFGTWRHPDKNNIKYSSDPKQQTKNFRPNCSLGLIYILGYKTWFRSFDIGIFILILSFRDKKE